MQETTIQSRPGVEIPVQAVKHAVSFRAVLIGFAFVPLYILFVMNGDFRNVGSLMGAAILNVPIVALLLVIAANQGLKRWWPSRVFQAGEILTIYCMVVISCGVASAGLVGGGLPSVMTYSFYYANPTNRWQELVWPWMPTWLTVQPKEALVGFWNGNSILYSWDILKYWVTPVFWWVSFMATLMWVCLCMNSIVRRRWADEERLPFPYAAVPLQMVEEKHGLFQNKGWWVGLGGAMALGVLNSLATVFPSVPSIPMSVDLGPSIANSFPWQAIGYRCSSIGWNPMYIGLSYLIPLELLPSLLFFELLIMAEVVISHAAGMSATVQGFPFIDQQTVGGLIALAAAMIWLDRKYFKQVGRKALGLHSTLRDDGKEALSYRIAVFGAFLGMIYLFWFWGRAGVPFAVLLVFFALYFSLVMVLSRIRAQVGSPTTDMGTAMPNATMRTVFGPAALSPASLSMFTLLTPYILGYQENNAIPFQLEAMKLAEGRMERRRLAVVLAAVVPVTVLCYFWFYLHFGYHYGIGTAKGGVTEVGIGRSGTEYLATMLSNPPQANTPGTLAIGFGALMTLVLLCLKLRFQGWPLHPIAFPVANAWGMHYMTAIFLLIWLFKSLTLRYGGLKMHRAAMPFFIGLLVGDLAAYTLESVVKQIFGIRI